MTRIENTSPCKVSVIIPTFNDDARLQLCLDALSKQTLSRKNYEVIVVNNSRAPISVSAALENIVFLQELKPGSYAARNHGVSVARGEVLAFTDSDCIPDRSWLESGLERIGKAGADRVGGRIALFYRRDTLSAAECYQKIFSFDQVRLVRGGLSVTANLFIRRSVFESTGPFNEKLLSGGDLEWNKRATRKGFNILYSEHATVHHPARHSWAELSRKTERIIGGTLSLNPDYQINLLRSVLPPLKAAKRIIRSKEDLRTMLLAFAIAYRMKISRFIFLRRLRSGTTTPRRA